MKPAEIMVETLTLYYPENKNCIPLYYRIRDYLKSGVLLHIIAIVTVLLSWKFNQLMILNYREGNVFGMIWTGYFFIYFGTIPFFAQLDARSRYQNFKNARDLFYKFGFQFRFARALRHSRCQREAAIYAAEVMGIKGMIKKYYYRCGYRWYHLFPDFIWVNPFYLFHRNFWKTTFFEKSYIPRYFKSDTFEGVYPGSQPR